MIVTAYNPSTEDLERSFLSQYEAEGVATIHVKNTDGFATSKAILIGNMGGEKSELASTDGVTPPDVVSLDGVTSFAHSADDPVYLMRWNRIRFYRSATIDGTYTLLATVAIDVDNSERVTRYDDTTGTATSYYKVKFYNTLSAEESDYSDPIRAEGYDVNTAGKVIDQTVRRVKDTNYQYLGIDEYIDIMNDVNDELLTQSHRPYRFQKVTVLLDTTNSQGYIDLTADVPDFWKFDYLVYYRVTGGVTHKYQIDEPLSLENFTSKYDNSNWLESDDLVDVAIDEANNRLLLGPTPKTAQTGVVELHYYRKIPEITGLGSEVITPNTLIYKYKMMAEYYYARSESDRHYLPLAQRYDQQYGNEVVKMPRANRIDTGTPRSFAPRYVRGMRKRYIL